MEDDYFNIDERDADGRKWMIRESVFFKTLYVFLREKKMWGEFYRDYEKSHKVSEEYKWIWSLEGAKQFERSLSHMPLMIILRNIKYKELSDDFERLLLKLNILQD